MLCQKEVRCDIQHFCDGSYTRSYYNDLYLTELSEDQVLIPPECSPNWKVQEKTWSLIGSDQKKKKKKEDWGLRILDVLIVGNLDVLFDCILKLVV